MVASTGPVIWRILFLDAATLSRFSSSIRRVVFSTTTIASSTTEPITRISANMVSTLIEYPMAAIKTNVPMMDTGIVSVGIKVARQS